MIPIPEQYIIQFLYENIYKISYNKFNKTYNGCCPICREGDSWGRKKRFYYIVDKEVAYCHNCGYSKKPIAFISEIANKPLQVIISEIKDFDTEISLEAPKQEKPEQVIKTESLPKDCINLTDESQVEYYKDNPFVRMALHCIKTRKLDKGVNSPKTFYISLTDPVHKNRLVLPFYDSNNNIVFYQTRGLDNKDLRDRPKYLSKVGAEKTLYGIQNVSADLDTVFIFEGPIDSYFVQNGLATCGITERGSKVFTALQQQQINSLYLHDKVFVLDNQYIDTAALNKSIILADNNERVFIWPRELRKFKDFNDICVAGNRDKIKPEFILKNTHSGLKAKLLLTAIKNS